MSKITTKWITDDAVTAAKVNADVAGDGLTPNGTTGALDINADGTTVEVATDTLQIKNLGVDTAQLAGASVTAAKLGSDVAGDGLTGGNGADIDVQSDATGGANLAKAIYVSANGVAVKVNDDTIGEDGSGQLEVKANSIGADEIDETDAYTWSGTNTFTGTTTVPAPTNGTDAVTKDYADALRAGLSAKGPVEALSASDIAITGDPGSIDGVSGWITGDRILLIAQSPGSENGIWEVDTTGPWTRPTDFFTGDEADGATTWVRRGTTYGDSQYTCVTDSPNDIIDTDALTFVQTSGAGQVTAGTGLSKSGNEIRVGAAGALGNVNGINRTADDLAAATDGTTVEVASNVIQVKAAGIDTTQLAGTSVTAAKLGSDVAGSGLTGGNGSALDVQALPTGGANDAAVINVAAGGVSVAVDDASIEENGSGQLAIKAGGIDENDLATSVAGIAIAGGGGSALDLDFSEASLPVETTADNADLVAIYDDTATAMRKMTRANFLSGVSGENNQQYMHLITGTEDTNGYFTLPTTPSNSSCVRVTPVEGCLQVNKQVVGATGASPDFDIISNTQVHFNNNGAGVGLSGDMESGDIVIVEYCD